MPKNWKMYILAFGIGIACSVAVFELVIVPHAVSGIGRELAAAKSSLVKSQADYKQLSTTNSGLQSKLADTVRFAEQQANELTTLRNKLAQGQQDVAGLQQTVTEAGGSILDTARAIAAGFNKLYDIYNPSTIGPRRN